MKDHFEVTKFLKNLDKNDLMNLGGALGLSYPKLKEMEPLRGDMVAAWLNKEDFVSEQSGEPSWESLKAALKKIGQTGLADTINDPQGRIHCKKKCVKQPILGYLSSNLQLS